MKGKEADWAQWCTPTLQYSWMRAGRLVTCLHIVDIFVKKNLVDLYLGLVFCSTDLNVCWEARTKLLCPYSSCSTTWEHVWWYLQCCSPFSGSCWLSRSFYMNYFFSISVKNIIGILSGTALSLLKNFYYIDPVSFQLLEPSTSFFRFPFLF